MFRGGDQVKHPSGEIWLLACDEQGGEVARAGLREFFAQASDCTLVKAATDEQRIETLERYAEICVGQCRGLRAKLQLEAEASA